MESERKSVEFERMAENSAEDDERAGIEESGEEFERRNSEFQKLLEVSPEERDRVQRMQVIDRAAAAIAAARALLQEEVSSEVRVEKIEDHEEGN